MKKKEELKNLRTKSKDVLYKEIKKAYEELRALKFSLAFKKLKDVRKLKKTRVKISRIWNILAEKINSEN